MGYSLTHCFLYQITGTVSNLTINKTLGHRTCWVSSISDFGFAISTIKNRLLETFCGSYAYCCPQILRGEPYDGKKADVWSMGVVLYAMACARLPFSEDDMRALVKEDFTNKIKFSKRVSKGISNDLTF